MRDRWVVWLGHPEREPDGARLFERDRPNGKDPGRKDLGQTNGVPVCLPGFSRWGYLYSSLVGRSRSDARSAPLWLAVATSRAARTCRSSLSMRRSIEAYISSEDSCA